MEYKGYSDFNTEKFILIVKSRMDHLNQKLKINEPNSHSNKNWNKIAKNG